MGIFRATIVIIGCNSNQKLAFRRRMSTGDVGRGRNEGI